MDRITFSKIINDVLVDIVKKAYDEGILIKEELSFVPELLMEPESLCHKLFNNIREEMENEGMEINPGSFESIVGRFCMFAGMGAVVLWNTDYQQLKKQGIYETLTKPKGLFCMDEYVFELIGLEFKSAEWEDFMNKTSILFPSILSDTCKRIKEVSGDDETVRQLFPETMTNAFIMMYRLGIAIQVQKIFLSGQQENNSDNATSHEAKYDFHALYKYIADAFIKVSGRYEYSQELYTDDLVNYLFKGFLNLSIDDKYTLGTYEYLDYYLPDNKEPGIPYYEQAKRRIYVHTKDASDIYKPQLEKTFIEKLFNRTPAEIHYKDTDFSDDMVIKGRICKEECIKNIPSPLSYIKCRLNEASAWEYYLLNMLVEMDWFPIIYSYEEAYKRLKGYADSSGSIRTTRSELEALEKYDFSPKVSINGNNVTIECVRERLMGLYVETLNLEYTGDTYVIKESNKKTLLGLDLAPGVNPIHIQFKLYPFKL